MTYVFQLFSASTSYGNRKLIMQYYLIHGYDANGKHGRGNRYKVKTLNAHFPFLQLWVLNIEGG